MQSLTSFINISLAEVLKSLFQDFAAAVTADAQYLAGFKNYIASILKIVIK